MLLLAFNIDKLPLLGRPVALGRALRGRRPQGRRRGTDRRGQGRQGRRRSTWRASHVRVDFRVGRSTELGLADLGHGPDQDHPRAEVPGPGARPARVTWPRRSRCPARRRRTTSWRRSATSPPPPRTIDTDQLATALDTVANTFRDSPEEVRAAVDGLGRLSRTVASRDAQLRELLEHANGVTGVLADRNEELQRCSPTATCCCRSCASGARTSTPCWSARSPCPSS